MGLTLKFATHVLATMLATTSVVAAAAVSVAPPADSADLGVQWMHVTTADRAVMLLAIARPAGEGPFPVVVILHGTHGFGRQYVELARSFAREGVLGTGGIAAAVLESAGYTDEQSARAPGLKVPILILHGAGDTSADGGSPFNTTQKARSFEGALRAAGKTVEAVYYQNAGHNGIFADPKQFDDSVRHTAAFLARVKVPQETR